MAPPLLPVRIHVYGALDVRAWADSAAAAQVELRAVSRIPDPHECSLWLLDGRNDLAGITEVVGSARVLGIHVPALVLCGSDIVSTQAQALALLDIVLVGCLHGPLGGETFETVVHEARWAHVRGARHGADPALTALFDATPFACILLDAENRVVAANRASSVWAAKQGFPIVDGASLVTMVDRWFGAGAVGVRSALDAVPTHGLFHADFHGPGGTSYQARIAPITMHGDLVGATVAGVVGPAQRVLTARDVTARRLAEQRLRHQATHDLLTGLPNRALLVERVEQDLGTRGAAALILIDIDRFKAVNDSMGLGLGDRLITSFGRRLSAALVPRHFVARLGGDEFAVLPHDNDDARAVAQRVVELARQPFEIDDLEIYVSASAGIGVAGSDTTAEDLLRAAGVATWAAKEAGGDRVEAHRSEMDGRAHERLRLETDVRHAIATNAFILHFQPIRDLRTGAWTAVEALLRWEHPERGSVPPASFLPLCEELGLMSVLTPWVLEHALLAMQRWRVTVPELAEARVHVNITAADLARVGFVDELVQILRSTQCPATLLGIEVTESAVMRDPERGAEVLRHLKELGLVIAIDDFGTGHSSLSWLSRLPVDMLKVDGSFVRGEGRAGLPIVRSVLAFAEAFGLDVVAEGVETELQQERVTEAGCTSAQGFVLSRPVPEGAVGPVVGGT